MFSTKPFLSLSLDEKSFLLGFIAGGVIFWALLFVSIRFSGRSHYICNRLVSIVHCIATLILTSLSVEDWHHPFSNLGGANTEPQVYVIICSFSYFIFDCFCCLMDDQVEWSMYLHHGFALVGLTNGIISGHCGTEIASCLWLVELSVPFMNLRGIFKDTNLQTYLIARMNDVMLAASYMFSRMVVGPLLFIEVWKINPPIGVKLAAIGIQGISIFWFYKILKTVFVKPIILGQRKCIHKDEKESSALECVLVEK